MSAQQIVVLTPQELDDRIERAVLRALELHEARVKAKPHANDLLTVSEVCAMLRIGRTSLYELRRSGKLKAVKVGAKGVRFHESEVRALFNH